MRRLISGNVWMWMIKCHLAFDVARSANLNYWSAMGLLPKKMTGVGPKDFEREIQNR